MSPDDPRHGTYAGYQQHLKSQDEPCTPCRNAASAYQRNHRETHPERVKKDRRRINARRRAMERVARLYPDEFDNLYNEELQKVREPS